MQAFTVLKSEYISMPSNDIDTDQIIPARFLKVIDKNGLGDSLFFDWRYNSDGSPKSDFVLNQEPAQGRQILVAGDNFGCGSSREHAPWALAGFGFRAIISTSFADIFKNNALKNGVLPIEVHADVAQKLFDAAENAFGDALSVELEKQILVLPDGIEVSFEIDNFSKTCLLEGIDQLGYIQKFAADVEKYEAAHSARINSLG